MFKRIEECLPRLPFAGYVTCVYQDVKQVMIHQPMVRNIEERHPSKRKSLAIRFYTEQRKEGDVMSMSLQVVPPTPSMIMPSVSGKAFKLDRHHLGAEEVADI